MSDDIFDVVVVGAGPAGTSCALTAAAGAANTVFVERGEYPGAKNVQGAVLYAKNLADIVPEFWKDPEFPMERNVVEQRYVITGGREDWTTFSFRGGRWNGAPNCFTILRSKFDQWYAKKAEEKGAQLFSGVTISDVMRADGRVTGVKTSEGEELGARCVVAADGVNSLVAQKMGLIDEWRMDEVAMGAKEVLALAKDKIEDRFALAGDEGMTYEFYGSIARGMIGNAFLYTNKETISIGCGALVSDLRKHLIRPYDLLDFIKSHPLISRLIAGATTLEYSAHLIPEGGFRSMPPLCADGFMIAGDAAQMVNSLHREGSNLAMTAGRLAAETVLEAKKRNDFSRASLKSYEDKIKSSFVWADLDEHKNITLNMERDPSVLDVYPRLMSEAMYNFFKVDGRSKRAHEKETIKMFLKERGIFKLLRDGWRLKDVMR